ASVPVRSRREPLLLHRARPARCPSVRRRVEIPFLLPCDEPGQRTPARPSRKLHRQSQCDAGRVTRLLDRLPEQEDVLATPLSSELRDLLVQLLERGAEPLQAVRQLVV